MRRRRRGRLGSWRSGQRRREGRPGPGDRQDRQRACQQRALLIDARGWRRIESDPARNEQRGARAIPRPYKLQAGAGCVGARQGLSKPDQRRAPDAMDRRARRCLRHCRLRQQRREEIQPTGWRPSQCPDRRRWAAHAGRPRRALLVRRDTCVRDVHAIPPCATDNLRLVDRPTTGRAARRCYAPRATSWLRPRPRSARRSSDSQDCGRRGRRYR